MEEGGRWAGERGRGEEEGIEGTARGIEERGVREEEKGKGGNGRGSNSEEEEERGRWKSGKGKERKGRRDRIWETEKKRSEGDRRNVQIRQKM